MNVSGSSETTLERVRALQSMDLEATRSLWRSLYGRPPALRSPELLRRLLAWKIQVDEFGGLAPELARALRKGELPKRGPDLHPGVKVAREWRGVRHDVEIVDGGVLYQGRRFKSLSAVAREITGIRWNGPRFFGLRMQEGP